MSESSATSTAASPEPARGKRRWLRRVRWWRVVRVLAVAVLVLVVAALVTVRTPPFGGSLDGTRREAAQRSPQFRDGKFHNPQRSSIDVARAARTSLFDASDEATPSSAVSYVATDAAQLAVAPTSGLRVTWFGHSSSLVEIDRARVLTDPFWSQTSGPFQFIGPGRFFPVPIALDKLGPIDAVVISHDHFDHLDQLTIESIRDGATGPATRFIVPLGMGAHLQRWGVPLERITELDWWQNTTVGALTVTATPARHESGRDPLRRGQTLWAGWALAGPQHRVWYSGDSSLHHQLDEIGSRLGPFDIAMVESGQYDSAWPDNHWGPEIAVEVARKVKATTMVPVHWALLSLAPHAWTEPVERVTAEAACRQQPMRVLRPGEPTTFGPNGQATPAATTWWPKLETRSAADALVQPSEDGDPAVHMDFTPCTLTHR